MSEEAAAAPMHFMPPLPAEEAARANFYALLARLFYAPPDEPLLRTLASSGDLDVDEGAMGSAWQGLVRAATSGDPEAIRDEYDTVFVGTGKSPVTLYACAYSMRTTNDVPLVDLKADLASLGLARSQSASEPEDHIAALCEVMRYIVTERPKDLEAQSRFFSRWVWPTVQPLCGAIEASPATGFYKSVSNLFREFCTLDHAAFEML